MLADFYGLKKYIFVFLFTGETGVFHKRLIVPNYWKCPQYKFISDDIDDAHLMFTFFYFPVKIILYFLYIFYGRYGTQMQQ